MFPSAVGVPKRSSHATTEKFCNPPPDSASKVKNTIRPTTFGVTSPRRPIATTAAARGTGAGSSSTGTAAAIPSSPATSKPTRNPPSATSSSITPGATAPPR